MREKLEIIGQVGIELNNQYYVYAHITKLEKAMQVYADQENEVLKIQLAAEKGISGSRLEDIDLLRYEVEVLQQQLENCKRKNISIIK